MLVLCTGKTWAHFIRRIPAMGNKKNPIRAFQVCANYKKRSETTWICEKYLVALDPGVFL